jgi:hypothetical protein
MGSRTAGQGQNEKPMAMMSVHRLGLEFFFIVFNVFTILQRWFYKSNRDYKNLQKYRGGIFIVVP